MKYYVSAQAAPGGDGTEQRPFSRIQQAAERAVAGDEVLVFPGIYREHVRPIHAGTAEKPVIYSAVETGKAIVTGAEPLQQWEAVSKDVYRAKIPSAFFPERNPFDTLIAGDWLYNESPVHVGNVYLDGRGMYEMATLEEVLEGKYFVGTWHPEEAGYTWYTVQEGDDTLIYVNLRGRTPTMCQLEISVRSACFFPDKEGIDHIHIHGFIFCCAATQWAPPTAFQEGAVGPRWAKGWVIENCEVYESTCTGISLGKYADPVLDNKWTRKRMKHGAQTQREIVCEALRHGWHRERVGGHTIRRCKIHDCGQTGIAGHMGCAFSTIEKNEIWQINTRQELIGAEIAGIKLHAAIDTVIRQNHIHHCTRGIWLDWQAQGTRVTRNLFHHNIPPVSTSFRSRFAIAEDLYIEVSHGPTLVDNNLLLSPYAGRLSAQGVAYVHNLIAGPFTRIGEGSNNGRSNQPRYTPYHVPHSTELMGFMTILHGDVRFYHNIFIHREIDSAYKECLERWNWHLNTLTGTVPYDGYPSPKDYFDPELRKNTGINENRERYYEHMPIYTGGNVYLNGAKSCDTEKPAMQVPDAGVTFILKKEGSRITLETNLFECVNMPDVAMVSSKILGEAFEPEQCFEAPDGSEIVFDEDFLGNTRFGEHVIAGPFANPTAKIVVWQ